MPRKAPAHLRRSNRSKVKAQEPWFYTNLPLSNLADSPSAQDAYYARMVEAYKKAGHVHELKANSKEAQRLRNLVKKIGHLQDESEKSLLMQAKPLRNEVARIIAQIVLSLRKQGINEAEMNGKKPRPFFEKVEVGDDKKQKVPRAVRISKTAVMTLLESLKHYLVSLSEDAKLFTTSRGAVTTTAQDLNAVETMRARNAC